jgi:hypothetical protein
MSKDEMRELGLELLNEARERRGVTWHIVDVAELLADVLSMGRDTPPPLASLLESLALELRWRDPFLSGDARAASRVADAA